MQIFTELGDVYWFYKVAYDIFRRWGKEFPTGIVRQRCSIIWPTCDCNRQGQIWKWWQIWVHFMLKRILKLSRKDFCQIDTTFIDRWPRTCTSTNRWAYAKNASQIQTLKFAIIGDETWVPLKLETKYGYLDTTCSCPPRPPPPLQKRKGLRRFSWHIHLMWWSFKCLCQRARALQVGITNLRCFFKNIKIYYNKRCPASGFRHIRLLHDNALHHLFELVQ